MIRAEGYLYQEGPETRPDELILKDPPHLLQHKLLHLAHILKHLLPTLLPPNLALDPNLPQQSPRSLLPPLPIPIPTPPLIPNRSLRVLAPQEAKMHLAPLRVPGGARMPQVRQHGDPVEAEPRDPQLERDPDEGRHRVVEQDLRRQRQRHRPAVGYVQRRLQVLRPVLLRRRRWIPAPAVRLRGPGGIAPLARAPLVTTTTSRVRVPPRHRRSERRIVPPLPPQRRRRTLLLLLLAPRQQRRLRPRQRGAEGQVEVAEVGRPARDGEAGRAGAREEGRADLVRRRRGERETGAKGRVREAGVYRWRWHGRRGSVGCVDWGLRCGGGCGCDDGSADRFLPF